jgi:hypothetical protein
MIFFIASFVTARKFTPVQHIVALLGQETGEPSRKLFEQKLDGIA